MPGGRGMCSCRWQSSDRCSKEAISLRLARYREAGGINAALRQAAPDMHVLATDAEWLAGRIKAAGCE
jgi:hypothetical protein